MDKVLKLIIGGMKATYAPPMLPNRFQNGYPEEEYLEAAYRLMKYYLELSTSDRSGLPPAAAAG